MRERKECHCMLFLTEDNDFAGEDKVRRDKAPLQPTRRVFSRPSVFISLYF